MIIATNEKLAIGEIKIPSIQYDIEGNSIEPQPVLIIKEVTKEEYVNYVLERNPDAEFFHSLFPYFYEIHTD